MRRAWQAASRRAARRVVGGLPVAVADAIRRPLQPDVAATTSGRARLLLLRVLREGGIPAAASTFRLVDDPDLVFVAADSLVLSRLYWYGQQGWEPELLPWWLHCCRHSRSVLELGANVGYFTVQGSRAASGARYVAVEPHPFSLQVCRANLDLNRVTSVQLVAAAAVADPDVASVRLLVPSDQLATPTVAFTAADTELPANMARDVTTELDVPAVGIGSLVDGVDLVKLDVEGQEHSLLAAARDHLRAARPTIFVEVLPGTVRLRSLLADLCTQDGYRCYVPSSQRLVQLDPARLAGVRLKQEYGNQDVILSAVDLPSSSADVDTHA